jgi:hypothetical protein
MALACAICATAALGSVVRYDAVQTSTSLQYTITQSGPDAQPTQTGVAASYDDVPNTNLVKTYAQLDFSLTIDTARLPFDLAGSSLFVSVPGAPGDFEFTSATGHTFKGNNIGLDNLVQFYDTNGGVMGGASFLFDDSGEIEDFSIATSGDPDLFFLNSNTLSAGDYYSIYIPGMTDTVLDVTGLNIQWARTGVPFQIPAVPLPATGYALLAGLTGLGLMRSRRIIRS